MIGPIDVDHAVLHQLESGEKAASPGMKYKHYAPRARVVLLRGSDERFITFMNRLYARDQSVAAICYDTDQTRLDAPSITIGSADDEKAQAQALFDALRAVDELDGVRTVYAHCPEMTGVGMALYNRLIRAAAFAVVDLPQKRIIGLTGQTGAGKSEAAKILKALGLPVVSADLAARQAVEDSEVKAMLCASFGDVLKEDGSLDRRLLAQLAFSSPGRTAVLNAITHPKIAQIMFEEARRLDGDTVVFDASQLFESREDLFCDHIIGVLASPELRLGRIMQRDGITREEAEQRMTAQYDERFFLDHCDDILYNNGSEQEFDSSVKELYERLVRE